MMAEAHRGVFADRASLLFESMVTATVSSQAKKDDANQLIRTMRRTIEKLCQMPSLPDR